ncbi:MAG: N-acetyltransferase [Nitrospirae bacterium]|nr:N-acetyltransferase [Nitrospirota bacterium]
MKTQKIRRATISDAKTIHKLVNDHARKEQMLPRSLNDIYECIRDFFVYDESSAIKGVCALKIVWEDLAEVRSLVVADEFQGKGIGTSLVKKCLEDAVNLGVTRVFSLTYRVDFFKRLGFKDINKNKLPQKIWGDCLKCHKFPDCDETAVIINL